MRPAHFHHGPGSDRQPEFPDRFSVRARLAAEGNNNFGWHLGISIGKVKTLFHPGVDGGAFRIETIPEHLAIVNNQEMGFTPQTDTMHDMTIEFQRKGQEAILDITIVDCKNSRIATRKSRTSPSRKSASWIALAWNERPCRRRGIVR